MTWVGWLGIDMLAAGLIAVAVEVLMLLPRLVRLNRRITDLNLLYQESLRLAHDDLQGLSRATAEMQELLRPYRRLQRWLAHPISVALYASYRRRSSRARSHPPAG